MDCSISFSLIYWISIPQEFNQKICQGEIVSISHSLIHWISPISHLPKTKNSNGMSLFVFSHSLNLPHIMIKLYLLIPQSTDNSSTDSWNNLSCLGRQCHALMETVHFMLTAVWREVIKFKELKTCSTISFIHFWVGFCLTHQPSSCGFVSLIEWHIEWHIEDNFPVSSGFGSLNETHTED